MSAGEQPAPEFDRLIQALPRTGVKQQEEERIYYMKVHNELTDLARLRLPLNLLYKRHVITIKRLEESAATPEDEQQRKLDSVFAFKDSRLRHLNK